MNLDPNFDNHGWFIRIDTIRKRIPFWDKEKFERIENIRHRLTDRNWERMKPKEDHVYSEVAQKMKDAGWIIHADKEKIGIYASMPLYRKCKNCVKYFLIEQNKEYCKDCENA